MTDNFPIRHTGRHSGGLSTEDWQRLACAYDTWNDCLAYAEEQGLSNVDPDLFDFVKDVFSDFGLWDDVNGEPMLAQYRQMFMTLC